MRIGIDIGGTKIRGVLLKNNKAVKKYEVKTRNKNSQKVVLVQIFKCIDKLIEGENKKRIKGIGLGVPSPIDFEKQRILTPPNLKALKNCQLAKVVKDKFRIKAVIDNDANCFTLAEALLGAGKGFKIVAGITIGTGVGGGIVIDKQIYHGEFGNAGEFGHINIVKNGWRCSCGRKGCVEAYVSGKGIIKIAKGLGIKNSNPKEIEDLARLGNKKAKIVYKTAGEYLGLGLVSIVNTIDPGIIVIGGGISHAGNLIINPAKEIVKRAGLNPLTKKIRIVKSKLGREAGAIGAALLICG